MTFHSTPSVLSHSGNGGTAVNAGNENFGGSQHNYADASGHAALHGHHGGYLTDSGNGGIAVNAGNINFGGSQTNIADASGHAVVH